MKKKILSLFSIAMCALIATSCGSSGNNGGQGDDESWREVKKEYLTETNIGTDKEVSADKLSAYSESNPLKIALVTDSGTIDDHSFNESAWKGVNDFAVKNGKGTIDKENTVKTGIIHTAYYQPKKYDTNSRYAVMKEAVQWGAKVLVLPGFLFQGPIKLAIEDTAFNDVKILALDCSKVDDDGQPYEYTDNITSVIYREEQSGFLAGYGAVMDGFRKLGFVGGKAVPAVVRYGSGYVQGAAYAAEKLNLEKPVTIQYYYAGEFTSTAEATQFAKNWYQNDLADVIFACGGAVYQSVTEATAGIDDAKWIGVDVNQYADTSLGDQVRSKIVTSAMKNLTDAVEVLLTNYCENDGNWADNLKGEVVTVGCQSDSCKLPTEAVDGEGCWGFETFTEAQYNEVYNKIKADEIKVNSYSDNDVLVEKNFGVNPAYCKVNPIE